MTSTDHSAFEQFVRMQRKKLQFIAWKTCSEYQFADVVNEAYVMADYISKRKGIAIDFLSESFQGVLLAYLYRHLVDFQEKKIRHSVRLEHAPPGSDDARPLLDRFAVHEEHEPMSLLQRAEAESRTNERLAIDPSLAAAYVRLLRHFDHRMQAVADHLLISVSYAYRCCAKARLLAGTQQHLGWPPAEELPLPRPWRRFKITRSAEFRARPAPARSPTAATSPRPCC